MKDLYNREIDYMRVSITDRCNLRCRYCMPEGASFLPSGEMLSFAEITAVCREAAALGIRKIKLTGGEPLVREGCAELAAALKALPGIEQVTLTTNGILLADYAEPLKKAGIDGVNVSLDTRKRAVYAKITGFDRLDDVLNGIEAALRMGLKVKVNAVLQPGFNEAEWEELVMLAKERPLDVRFIEMMPIGQGKGLESVSNAALLERVKAKYPQLAKDCLAHGNGPAVYYRIPGFMGSIGFISAIHGKFCAACNRIRLTADGVLKPCLCYEEGISIKKSVRNADIQDMRRILERAVRGKPGAHSFEEEEMITEKRNMAQIGG